MPYYNSGHSPSAYNKDGGSSGPSSNSGGRTNSTEPTYMMEHLATFTVTKETGIVYPADGMRRLLQLEKSNGIWSQKMQLRLERNWVLIMDNETGAVMERFPASLIQEPTAFTSRDPMEMYNNILVFTVADDSGSGQRAEMHIFQCQSVSAQDLVEDLKMLQMGKLVPGGSPRGPRGHIPPPPALPPPEPPLNGVNVREQVSAFNASNDDAMEIRNAKDTHGPVKDREPDKRRESLKIVEVHAPPRSLATEPTSQKSTPPPPPPPPPLQTQKSTTSTYSSNTGTTKSNKSYGGMSNHDQVREELKYVLTMFRDKKRNPDAVESQDVFLDEYSTPREVQRWLAVKGFSEKVCKQLKDMTGSNIFSLSRKQLEQYFGSSEGGRLEGQITLARNECGYKGTRSSELKQILEKARRKAELTDNQGEM